MEVFKLLADEVLDIENLISRMLGSYNSVESMEFLNRAAVLARYLPERLAYFLNCFKRNEELSGACLISGFPVNDSAIGPTPSHWKSENGNRLGLREDFLLILFSFLLGDPISWDTQQDGRLVHQIVPIQGHEFSQINSASLQTLFWHTEDAFHPYRADYVGLMCLRNPTGAATTVASMSDIRLSDSAKRLLFQPLYAIFPDESHPKLRGESLQPGKDREPEYVPVLFGDFGSPYIRADPYYMDAPASKEAASALDDLNQAIEVKLSGVVLRPGDCLFVDNFRAVHGRKPFQAKFDGKDRWLKRVNIARDLRKSRDARRTSSSPMICAFPPEHGS